MYEVTEQYGFVATHQIHGLAQAHPCAGVHSHRWIAEVVLTVGALLPTDGPSELVVLEPLRRYFGRELEGRHLNDLLLGAPTPARLAWHVAAWCQENLTSYAAMSLSAIIVSSGANSRVRYTVPRSPKSIAR